MENPAFDEQLIGEFIAAGGEHKVYHYGERQVIKFPFGPRYWFNPSKYCENLRRDELIVRRHFGEYLVPREIHYFYEVSKPSYVIIEPLIQGRHLLKNDLKDHGISQQFRQLVEINNEMMQQEEISAEFFGLRGLLLKGKREASNMMLDTKSNRICLTDAGVIHFGRNKDQQILISLATTWALKRQKSLINHYLND